MTEWSLPRLLAELHSDIQQKLARSRGAMGHPVAMGDATEEVWLEMLSVYLPQRYRAEKAFVVDSKGKFSEQIDVLIFDRQYTPLVFTFKGQTVVPAEGVYAAFEAKQGINADQVKYAQQKVASVRRLYRTSLPIPSAGGTLKAKKPHHILGGLLTFESAWRPALGSPLRKALQGGKTAGALDLGCVAAAGIFGRRPKGSYDLLPERKPATAFLFDLITRLQRIATAPMIDLGAYAKWLDVSTSASTAAPRAPRGKSGSRTRR